MVYDFIKPLISAIHAKAPIVAIPVPGHAPVCINRSRLAEWSKGLVITQVRLVKFPDEMKFELVPPERDFSLPYDGDRWRPEGPENRIEVVVVGEQRLQVDGRPEDALYPNQIRCRARFCTIKRNAAFIANRDWADKERDRQEKKRMLGVLGLTEADKRAMRRLKYENGSKGMIETNFARQKRGKLECMEQRKGFPVSMPLMPLLRFAVVRTGSVADEYGTVDFRVTETVSGMCAGSGGSAEAAILDAQRKMAATTQRKLRNLEQKILGGRFWK